MRLQLSIHRNALPPVQIIFTTGTGPSSHTKSRSGSTIADLLHDVNDLVPLESEDGEWGLEDYIVEVAATADQEGLYECLHFQSIESVLREDDEVVVRYMGGDELRARRLGGRLQISGEGRHLIDGVVWGRRWVKSGGRPGVRIPPRKRRRILATEEDDGVALEDVQPLRAIEVAGESDEEDDEDYEDKENVDYEKAVAVRGDFEDADEGSEEDSEGVEEDEIQLLLKDAEEMDDASVEDEEDLLERQLKERTRLGKRKRDAIDDGHDESVFEGFSTPVKATKHVDIVIDEDDEDETSSSDSDSDSGSDSDSMMADIATKQAKQIEANILGDSDRDASSDTSYESDSADSSAEDEEDEEDEASSPEPEQKITRAKPEKERLTLPKQSPKRSEISQSETSDSESDDSAPSTSSSISGGDFTSSSGSDMGSDSESTSSSESESDSEDEQPKQTSHAAAVEFANKLESLQVSSSALQAVIAETPQQSAQQSQQPTQSAPGQGKGRTHKKNERVKRAKYLKSLKEAGELPAHANFSDLIAYEEQQSAAAMSSDPLANDLEAARARLLTEVQGPDAAAPADETTVMETSQAPEVAQDDAATMQMEDLAIPEAEQNHVTAAEKDSAITDAPSQATPAKRSSPAEAPSSKSGSAAKRAKLDIAASRRLLFGSLGLRTPKTPAEEQALREKLGKKVRPEKVKETMKRSSEAQALNRDPEESSESWKDKLIISAVECVKEGVTYPPPPFPFVQHWHKKGNKRRSSVDTKLHYDGSVSPSVELEEEPPTNGFAPDISTVAAPTQEDQVSDRESRTLSFEKEDDGLPIPTDFDALANLDRLHLVKGAIIAYKEIHVGAETNFQPEVSAYRVAEVDSFDEDGFVTVILAKRDRRKNSSQDVNMGEGAGNNFEIDGSQDEEDDGFRELEWAFMLQPKLIEAAKIQVPESAAPSSPRGCDGETVSQQKSGGVIPESIEEQMDVSVPEPTNITIEQVEIDTPRRKEITTMIKDAGFESAMDEQLLDPLPAEERELPASSQSMEEDEQGPILSDPPPAYVDGHRDESQLAEELEASVTETSKVVIDKGDWSSSPLFPTGEDHNEMNVNDGIQASTQQPEPSSSPPVSPQLTVEYPHISQMGLGSSATPHEESTRQSSSHQDAQKVPAAPAVQDGDTMPEDENLNFQDDDDLDSLHSEVPQTQSQDRQEDNEGASNSFLGKPGYDGAASSEYHESDDDPVSDDSESSLPSLRELTSSQKRKITTTKSKNVSPPPVRRNGIGKTTTRESSASSANDDDELLLPPPSQPAFKVSASQAEKQRSISSQLPLGTQVVDLTLSSDPVSPGNSDGEYGIMRPRKPRRSGQHNGTKPKTRASTFGTSVSDVGIGTKRFLTTKKTRSQAVGGSKDGGYF